MSEVSLVSVSMPRVEGISTPDELVAYCARVSNPSNQLNGETAPRLIAYLIRKAHWSPLEMVSLTLQVDTTRDIARQLLRHRSFAFQEFSFRYADPTQALGFKIREARLQDPHDRQNSIVVDDPDLQSAWEAEQARVRDAAEAAYRWAVDRGIAKEQARAVLPEGMTRSRLYVAGTLRSWYHYCDLRTGPETQAEHREVAVKAWDVVSREFPSVAAARASLRRA